MDERAVCFVTQSRLKRREMEDLKGVNKSKKIWKEGRETKKKEFHLFYRAILENKAVEKKKISHIKTNIISDISV